VLKTHRFVQAAIDYIEENLNEDLELGKIASKASLSVPHLYRGFYALTGHPIMEYIRKRRISAASVQLRYTNKTVMDISIECGFETCQSFSKMFKKIVGLTPGVYRRSNLFFSFEPINILEKESYTESRELFEHFPEVKVVRLNPLKAAVYRYVSNNPSGIEFEAYSSLKRLFAEMNREFRQFRIFGYNKGPNPGSNEYVFLITGTEEGLQCLSSKFHLETFPGGLFATSKTTVFNSKAITSAWDRLYSEWLPRSTFQLGDQLLMEEFQEFQGGHVRLKLYLPVLRRHEQDTIRIESKQRIEVFSFKEFGPDAHTAADARLSSWLDRNTASINKKTRLFMSYSNPYERSETYWHELAVSIPEGSKTLDRDEVVSKRFEEGLYATLTTPAYGLMTGILDRLHGWLYFNNEYDYDDSRQWFAEYIFKDNDSTECTLVKSHIPVCRREHFECNRQG
jgi:AraC family transcriptional regulator